MLLMMMKSLIVSQLISKFITKFAPKDEFRNVSETRTNDAKCSMSQKCSSADL